MSSINLLYVLYLYYIFLYFHLFSFIVHFLFLIMIMIYDRFASSFFGPVIYFFLEFVDGVIKILFSITPFIF